MAITGKSKVSGHEVLVPTPRQVAVARAYVDGLERDRELLRDLEERTAAATWEMIQLAAYSRALFVALYQLLRDVENGTPSEELLERISDLLQADAKVYDEVNSCACGHSKFDHDESGCQYLGCKAICGSRT